MICKSCGLIQDGAGQECTRCNGRLQNESPTLTRIRGHFAKKYQFARLIGSGGYADVYLAQDILLERDVAFKVLHAAYTQDPQMKERFIREARLYARLEHPNLIPIYDTGMVDDDVYIAMKYIEGETLKNYIMREKRIASPAMISQIVDRIGTALEYIHESGIVHRDIKPANILLEKRSGNTFLADFGIARFESSQTLTHTGMIIGTPFYISPEQIKGKKIDRRSDIYALGATLYELISGEPPFQGQTPLEIMYQHVNEEAEPLRQKVPGVAPLWSDIVARCMQKDPQKRFQKVGEILALLRSGEETTTQPLAASGRVALRPKRKKRLIYWLAPATFACLAAVFYIVAPGVWRRESSAAYVPSPAGSPGGAVQEKAAATQKPEAAPGTEKAAPDFPAASGTPQAAKPEPQAERRPEQVPVQAERKPEQARMKPESLPVRYKEPPAAAPPTGKKGTVVFSSFPPTLPADVYYNGRKIGTTEQLFESDFPPGKYVFSFVVPDYQSVDIAVEVKPGERVGAHHKFSLFREYTINAVPFGTVFIDGQEIGSTPCHPKITYGSHRVRIVKPGYKPQELTIEVNKDANPNIAVKLIKEE